MRFIFALILVYSPLVQSMEWERGRRGSNIDDRRAPKANAAWISQNIQNDPPSSLMVYRPTHQGTRVRMTVSVPIYKTTALRENADIWCRRLTKHHHVGVWKRKHNMAFGRNILVEVSCRTPLIDFHRMLESIRGEQCE